MSSSIAIVWIAGVLSAAWTDAIELRNVVPPFEHRGHLSTPGEPPVETPVHIGPIEEHVRGPLVMGPDAAVDRLVVKAQGGIEGAAKSTVYAAAAAATGLDAADIEDVAASTGATWIATANGLYRQAQGSAKAERHGSYGVGGPLATHVTSVAVDDSGRVWAGTPLGLSVSESPGEWRHIRGRDGLPYEHITAIALDGKGGMWLGTPVGLIHYRPDADGRQWFYRAGKRYLANSNVLDVAVDGDHVYALTPDGVSRLDIVETTLEARAMAIEELLNERHRRMGLVAECVLDDALNPTSHAIYDNDNDGLWTAYHVAAMSLAYGATGEDWARESAKQGMEALYMLQNASGIPGLVARSVVPISVDKSDDPQWLLMADGKHYWKSDTSSDEIDGHYLAFYAYYEHIAKHDEAERAKLVEQVRTVTDYIIEGGYKLIDWDGERTRWGFWDPESLNRTPQHYLENGLNSLQILSFLKTAHYTTGDAKYEEHYRKLIVEHDYLSNVLLEKRLFPDSNNHSDDQLGFVAWYPILQTEQDPVVRRALHLAVRRHAKIEVPERSPFFNFVYATIAPDDADILGGVQTLIEIPTDRRQWAMANSHRHDVVFHPRLDRFNKAQLQHVLPADERNIAKWNTNPYVPDSGGITRRGDDTGGASGSPFEGDSPRNGTVEDDGTTYLLPYWMGRYHGFIAAD